VSAVSIKIPESEERQVKRLADAMVGRKSAVLVISDSSYEVPTSICHLFEAILKITQEASSLSIIPDLHELTTQEAANLMNVSRQYLVRLLDDEKIPCHKVGSHRRIYAKDLLAYRRGQKRPHNLGLADLPQYSFDWK
jgi:excisionase family DNA binding protein